MTWRARQLCTVAIAAFFVSALTTAIAAKQRQASTTETKPLTPTTGATKWWG